MRRNGLFIGTVLVIIAVVAVIIVLSSQSRVSLPAPTPNPTRPPTVALHEIITIPSRCDYFNADWSLAGGLGKVYDTTTGKLRFDLKLSEVSFSSDLAYVGGENDGVYDAHSAQKLFPLGMHPELASRPKFSPDNKYVAMVNDGVYELPGGK